MTEDMCNRARALVHFTVISGFFFLFLTHQQIAYVVDFGKSVCFIAKHKTNRRADEVMFKCHGFEAESPDQVSGISHCLSYL